MLQAVVIILMALGGTASAETWGGERPSDVVGGRGRNGLQRIFCLAHLAVAARFTARTLSLFPRSDDAATPSARDEGNVQIDRVAKVDGSKRISWEPKRAQERSVERRIAIPQVRDRSVVAKDWRVRRDEPSRVVGSLLGGRSLIRQKVRRGSDLSRRGLLRCIALAQSRHVLHLGRAVDVW